MTQTISVIGTGYLGAVHAVCMAHLGHTVLAYDVDEEKIAALSAGRTPLYEPGLEELLEDSLATGRLTFTSDLSAIADADVHFICVGTPQSPGENRADLTYVYAAADALGPHLRGSTASPVPMALRMASRRVQARA